MYRRKSSSRRFYPTPLAAQLAGGTASVRPPPGENGGGGALLAGGGSGAAAVGFDGIIVETNFRVYAYTESEHAMLLLSLFVRIEYILPNLAVGTLTRESVCGAFAHGITATEIVRFIYEHAHTQVALCRDSSPPHCAAESWRPV